jgi:hypothetical protein
MHIRGKIFLQFLSSWMLMPVALFLAQLTGIAQRPDFIAAIILNASISPILIYLNEVFAPIMVQHRRHISVRHVIEVAIGVLFLSCWAIYRLDLDGWGIFLALTFAQGNIWFSYFGAKRLLEYQATSVIGGRYSYLIGAIVPTTFLLLVLCYWALTKLSIVVEDYFYVLLILPNLLQYLYTRYGWMENKYKHRHKERAIATSTKLDETRVLKYFIVAISMALISQHWKIELAAAAVGFAAISIYCITPFSSIWLIVAKSRFVTAQSSNKENRWMFLAPLVTALTLLFCCGEFWTVLLLAILTQVLAFKFITDIRDKLSSKL